jgi:hypothetical protein
MEATGLYGVHDMLGQHQVSHVRVRDDHALTSGQLSECARPVEALDLLVDATDRLQLAC